MMRTTVNIPDDLYEVVRSLAAAKHISMGEAMAELLTRALHPAPRVQGESAFPRFSVAAGARPITLEHTLEIEDQP